MKTSLHSANPSFIPDAINSARAHFSNLRDPRRRRGKRHNLCDVVFISPLAMICDCDDADEIADWAEDRSDWLSTWFSLPHGTPSQDTILRVFALIKPESLETSVRSWLTAKQIKKP